MSNPSPSRIAWTTSKNARKAFTTYSTTVVCRLSTALCVRSAPPAAARSRMAVSAMFMMPDMANAHSNSNARCERPSLSQDLHLSVAVRRRQRRTSQSHARPRHDPQRADAFERFWSLAELRAAAPGGAGGRSAGEGARHAREGLGGRCERRGASQRDIEVKLLCAVCVAG
eukprot:scaffold2314_cov267-Pinguiococcus_pyrenoidosus.AAC.5